MSKGVGGRDKISRSHSSLPPTLTELRMSSETAFLRTCYQHCTCKSMDMTVKMQTQASKNCMPPKIKNVFTFSAVALRTKAALFLRFQVKIKNSNYIIPKNYILNLKALTLLFQRGARGVCSYAAYGMSRGHTPQSNQSAPLPP